MNLSSAHKLLLAVDPFSAVRTHFRGWKKGASAKGGKKKRPKLLRGRHLTIDQRAHISAGLQDTITGPVSMTAAPTDKEAVCYQGEIASVLEDTGFNVEIDNVKGDSSAQKIPTGVEMTIADTTIRPSHAYRVVQAFRRAGVAIATRINGKRRKKNTLYITVGPNDAPALTLPTIRKAAAWRSKSLATVLAKWKMKFSSGFERPGA
jgi:hypothetical protein